MHLAGGIAADWWRITGGRNEQHSILPYRTGFILPYIVLKYDGWNFTTAFRKMRCQNPPLDFQLEGSETVPRAAAEREPAAFVDAVNERLTSRDVRDTELRRQWRRVKRSRQDPEVSEFCEAAGALRLDPYEIGDAEARFIDQAAEKFSGSALFEFLARLRGTKVASWRSKLDAAESTATSRPCGQS